jgi:hypothetical protein
VNGAMQARDSRADDRAAEMKWLNGCSLAATFEGEFSNVTTSYAGRSDPRFQWRVKIVPSQVDLCVWRETEVRRAPGDVCSWGDERT